VCRTKTDSPQRANELWLMQIGFVRALDFGSSVVHKIEGVKLGSRLSARMPDPQRIVFVILNAVKDPDFEFLFLDFSPCSE
jgi:hypothetical protein